MSPRFLAVGTFLCAVTAMVSAQQPPARAMSPTGSAQTQVLGKWTKGPNPAFTLGVSLLFGR